MKVNKEIVLDLVKLFLRRYGISAKVSLKLDEDKTYFVSISIKDYSDQFLMENLIWRFFNTDFCDIRFHHTKKKERN